MVAENVVQHRLVVAAALRQPLEHEHTGHAELTPAELPHPGAADADRPGGYLASGQIVMHKVDGWDTLATKPSDQPFDLAA